MTSCSLSSGFVTITTTGRIVAALPPGHGRPSVPDPRETAAGSPPTPAAMAPETTVAVGVNRADLARTLVQDGQDLLGPAERGSAMQVGAPEPMRFDQRLALDHRLDAKPRNRWRGRVAVELAQPVRLGRD